MQSSTISPLQPGSNALSQQSQQLEGPSTQPATANNPFQISKEPATQPKVVKRDNSLCTEGLRRQGAFLEGVIPRED